MGIALELYRACRQTVEENGGGRIDAVRLAVGELSAVEPDLIRFAWEAVTTDTGDAGAGLEIDWRPAQQYCAVCAAAKTRSEGSWLRLCPDCASPLRVDGGDDLDILQITFSTDDE